MKCNFYEKDKENSIIMTKDDELKFSVFQKFFYGREVKVPKKTKELWMRYSFVYKPILNDSYIAIDKRKFYMTLCLAAKDIFTFFANIIIYSAKKRKTVSPELEFLRAKEDCPKERKIHLINIIMAIMNLFENRIKHKKIKNKNKHLESYFKFDNSLAAKLSDLDKKFKEDKLFRNIIEFSFENSMKQKKIKK